MNLVSAEVWTASTFREAGLIFEHKREKVRRTLLVAHFVKIIELEIDRR